MFSGSELSKVGTFAGVMAQQAPVVLGLGHSKEIRLFVLPSIAWREELERLYGDAYERNAQIIDLRDLRSEAAAARVVMGQVDRDWKPGLFGVIQLGGEDAAYLVPANAYWEARVNAR